MPANTAMAVPYDPSAVWDGSVWYGSSLKKPERIGRSKNTSLVGCDFVGVNAYFVESSEARGKFREPFTTETYYEPRATIRWDLSINPGSNQDLGSLKIKRFARWADGSSAIRLPTCPRRSIPNVTEGSALRWSPSTRRPA
jgi:hypothetical protein